MKTRTTHDRVIPRDLFNDANILECLGRLALVIHTGTDDKRPTPEGLEIEHDGRPFDIVQDPADGELSVANVIVTNRGKPIPLATVYNSRGAYPLYATIDGETVKVFDDYGKFESEFLAALEPPQPDNGAGSAG